MVAELRILLEPANLNNASVLTVAVDDVFAVKCVVLVQ